jgi:hypothetical protein
VEAVRLLAGSVVVCGWRFLVLFVCSPPYTLLHPPFSTKRTAIRPVETLSLTFISLRRQFYPLLKAFTSSLGLA